VVFFYLYLIFIPDIGLLTLNHDVAISTNIFSPPQTAVAIVSLAVLIVLAFRLGKRYNLIGFAIAWFLIHLLIESTIIPLEIMYEHRTYLPGVMVFFLMALGIMYTGKVLFRRERIILLTSFILVLYGHGTYLRNVVFSNTISMWEDVVDKSPDLARGYSNLGKAYHDHGYYAESAMSYKHAVALDGKQTEALVNLATYYAVDLGQPEYALKLAKKAFITKPKIAIAAEKMADIYMRLKDYKRAEHYYALAVRRRNFFSNAINGLAVAKIRLGKNDKAIQVLKYGLKIDPSFALFYKNLALLYADDKKFNESIRLMKEYINKSPGEKSNAKALLAHIKHLSEPVAKQKN